MRLHRFYTPGKIGDRNEVSIDSPDLDNQIRKVFRLSAGDKVILFDGSGMDYTALVGSSNVFKIISSEKSRYMPKRPVTLYASLVKKDNFEWIAEKAAELGVTKVVPILAMRSEKKDINLDRLNRIAIEASEQSGRGDVPLIGSTILFSEAIAEAKNGICFHTEGEAFKSGDLVNNDPTSIFIGPEGGWSPEELKLFHENKIKVRCLGSQVLRAETAVVAALALVVFNN